jgi:UDP-glucose 4-epimerase
MNNVKQIFKERYFYKYTLFMVIMAQILVTGGAGFIGSHVVDDLVKAGNSVVVLDDFSGGFKENVNPRAELVIGSVTDYNLIIKLFEKYKFDYVFHIAAYAAEGLSHFIRRFNYENNLMGSVNIINASIIYKVKCLVFTSSIAVYGKNQLPMTEDTFPAPEDPYGISKLAVERDLGAAHEMFGLNYIIFRPHNVYGERQNIGDKYRNVVGIFMNQIMQGRELTIFGDGEQTRAFSYIGDISPIIANSINVNEAYCQVFNIGADIPYTVNRLANEVIIAMGAKEKYPIRYLPQRNEVVHAYSAHEKVKEFLGYRNNVSLSEGLKKMSDWAKKTGSKKSKEFDNLEVTERLPPSWKKQ